MEATFYDQSKVPGVKSYFEDPHFHKGRIQGMCGSGGQYNRYGIF